MASLPSDVPRVSSIARKLAGLNQRVLELADQGLPLLERVVPDLRYQSRQFFMVRSPG
jgi:hypothetical protein